MTLLRAGLFFAGLFVLTIVLGIIGLPVLCASRKVAARFGKLWSGCVLWWLRMAVGLDWELRGENWIPTAPAIIAVKHQSALEAFALHQIFHDPAIVCKQELLKIPIFGWYLKKSGVIAIDRKGGARALRRMISDSRAVLSQKRSIAIFPEGTRGPLGGKLPYQSGVGALYAQLDAPLVPVALNTGLFWGRGLLDKRKGRAIIEILEPILPGYDRRSIMDLLESRIEQASNRLIRECPSHEAVDNCG